MSSGIFIPFSLLLKTVTLTFPQYYTQRDIYFLQSSTVLLVQNKIKYSGCVQHKQLQNKMASKLLDRLLPEEEESLLLFFLENFNVTLQALLTEQFQTALNHQYLLTRWSSALI